MYLQSSSPVVESGRNTPATFGVGRKIRSATTMRTITFKLAKDNWFMVKLSGYYDDKKDTYHLPIVVFDESLFNTKEVGDSIKVV